jgi:hypothetical protein
MGELLALVGSLIVVELRREVPKLARGAVRGVKRLLCGKPEADSSMPLSYRDVEHIQKQIRAGARPAPPRRREP